MEHAPSGVLGVCQVTTHRAPWYLLAEQVLAQAKGGWSAHLTLQSPVLLCHV